MIRLIITVILCILSAGAAAWLALNPGTVVIEFLGSRYEAPFALSAGLLLVLTFALVALWWGVAKVWTAPDAFRRFRARRRREQGFDALERALIAAAGGEGELAVRQAARADALLDRPALSRLLAARAAEAAGDLNSAETHYEALLADARTRMVARRGLTAIAEQRGETRLALEHAGDAFRESRLAGWAFDALFDAQVRERRWLDAADTLSEAERRRQIEPEPARRRRAVLLTAAAAEKEADDRDEAADLAERAAVASPGFAPAAAMAARLLIDRRRHKRAADLIEAAWSLNPHPALARLYANLRKSDTKAKRSERIKGLAALNPDHRESKLMLAERALDARNADAARADLAPLLAEGAPSARLCALAARLARLDGDDDLARRWITRAAHAAGEPDWSDIDGQGRAFAYGPDDWARMVYAWGDEARLIHPRHERYEIAAEAVPETALLEAPKPARTPAPEPKTYFEPGRAPDDPGVGDEAGPAPARPDEEPRS